MLFQKQSKMSDIDTESDHGSEHDSEYDETEVQYHQLSEAKPTVVTHSSDDITPVTADSRIDATTLVFKWAPGGPGGAPEDLDLLIKLGIVTK